MGLAKEIAMAQTFGSGGGSGGVQPDYLQNNETAADYIKNRPFYTTDPVETELVNGTFAFTSRNGTYETQDINIRLIDGQTYTVVFDGVEYSNLMCFHIEAGNTGVLVIGLKSMEEEWYTTCPFVYQDVTLDDGTKMSVFVTNIEGDSHDIIIKGSVSTAIPIPDKYIPKSVRTTEIIDDSGVLVFSDTGKAVTFSDITTLVNHEIILKKPVYGNIYYDKCLHIQIDESIKRAYLMFASLDSSLSNFSNVSLVMYVIDENGTIIGDR